MSDPLGDLMWALIVLAGWAVVCWIVLGASS